VLTSLRLPLRVDDLLLNGGDEREKDRKGHPTPPPQSSVLLPLGGLFLLFSPFFLHSVSKTSRGGCLAFSLSPHPCFLASTCLEIQHFTRRDAWCVFTRKWIYVPPFFFVPTPTNYRVVSFFSFFLSKMNQQKTCIKNKTHTKKR
jgi:hypothetical protein